MYNPSSTSTIKYNNERGNKDICDAFGCSKQANNKIDVNAGTYGTIALNFCTECAVKFQ